MNHIIIISAVFPPEPVVSARLAHDLANKLSEEFKVTVLSPKPTRPYGFKFNKAAFIDARYTQIQLNSFTCPESSLLGRLRESYSFGKETAKYIRTHSGDIDAIYADTWPLFAQYFIVREAKQHHIPVAMHIQDVYPESFANKLGYFSSFVKYMLLPFDKYILRNASFVIAISEFMKSYLSATRKISDNKISVVLNWQDEEPFLTYHSKEKQSDRSHFVFMYLGNIGPVAGVDLLIDAFIKADISQSKLVIAGSGSMKEELSKKAQKSTNSNIEFWDVPEGKVPEIQSRANVMLLPIKKGAASSSIPSKLPAYLFSSRPVISCVDLDSDTAKCILDANCGYVIEPENCEELSKCMIKVSLEDPSVLNQLGEKGRTYALKKFSKNVNLNQLKSIVASLIYVK